MVVREGRRNTDHLPLTAQPTPMRTVRIFLPDYLGLTLLTTVACFTDNQTGTATDASSSSSASAFDLTPTSALTGSY